MKVVGICFLLTDDFIVSPFKEISLLKETPQETELLKAHTLL